ncbi:putative membrane protein YkvI [Scopulibacillus daqui]|uniref:Membrane protein YkvI n=1 Tax=Scopulibacillus daqui TaxID=1469162 RepID=A0ABS2Q4D5_9BACL|nr:transporter [Scopulibacillus daqui]MBM7646986.1 putative membrane protein YkvI [Scopulibacillus daqui]
MNKIKLIFQVAATFIGTIVGAGFATGKEIVQFFTQYNSLGTLGILISGLFFTFLGTKLLIYSNRINAYSYKELNDAVFGRRVGLVINLFIFLMLIGTTSVMLSGAGAVFREQLGLSKQLGLIITMLLCFLFLLKGLKGVFAINSLVVPIMFLFTMSSLWHHFMTHGFRMFLPEWTAPSPGGLYWLVSALSYVGFNLVSTLAIIVPIGREIKDERVLKWGGIFGGIGFTVLLLSAHFVLLNNQHAIGYEIPIGEIVKYFGFGIHLAFIFVIYGEIFTTFIGNVFGLSRQIGSLVPFKQVTITLMILVCMFFFSQISYGLLISTLYPLYGYLSMICLIYFTFIKMPSKTTPLY